MNDTVKNEDLGAVDLAFEEDKEDSPYELDRCAADLRRLADAVDLYALALRQRKVNTVASRWNEGAARDILDGVER